MRIVGLTVLPCSQHKLLVLFVSQIKNQLLKIFYLDILVIYKFLLNYDKIKIQLNIELSLTWFF